MDGISNAFVLELVYRLTIAVNMAENRLESFEWRESWHNDILSCAREWMRRLSKSIVDNAEELKALIHSVNDITIGLAPGYAGLAGNPLLPSNEVFVYQNTLGQVQRIAHVFSGWGLADCFALGRQLALMDLSSRIQSAIVDSLSSATTGQSDPGESPQLPIGIFPESFDPGMRERVSRLLGRWVWFINKTDSFTIGGWFRFFMALLNPDRNPSILWAMVDSEFPKHWDILVAGNASAQPAVIHGKNVNDQALVKLVVRMKDDKEAGISSVDCGWEVCQRGLWESHERGALESARNRLIVLARPLGQLEYVDGRKTNLPHCCELRLPEAWASPEGVILIAEKK
jgi:hypothetical protein